MRVGGGTRGDSVTEPQRDPSPLGTRACLGLSSATCADWLGQTGIVISGVTQPAEPTSVLNCLPRTELRSGSATKTQKHC